MVGLVRVLHKAVKREGILILVVSSKSDIAANLTQADDKIRTMAIRYLEIKMPQVIYNNKSTEYLNYQL